VIFRRWRRSADARPRRTREERRLDGLLAERVAAHFPGSRVDGATVETGSAGLRLDCRTGELDDSPGGGFAVPLFFHVSGGAFGPRARFASMSGYGDTPEAAVVEGACIWTCSFKPVLQQALGGPENPEVTTFEVVRDGRRYSAVVREVERAWTFSVGDTPAPPLEGLVERARALLGGTPMLTPRVVASSDLPAFTEQHTLVSVFVMLLPDQVTYEVKVNGVDWEPACVHGEPADGIAGALVLLRELAVLTLLPGASAHDGSDERLLTREEFDEGLRGLTRRTGPGWAAGWPGWRRHGDHAGDVLTDDALGRVEARTGRLPDDYRRFLTEVAGPGAGPGYGLAVPIVVEGSLVLAHAGCKAAWVLRLDPDHFGEVWLDARDQHGTWAPVSGSFTAWMRQWFAEAAGERPWVQWDLTQCSHGPEVVQHVRALRSAHPGARVTMQAIAHPGEAGRYVPAGLIDPCQGCADLAYRVAGSEAEFLPGPLGRRG
jgi:hypothetical protein